MNIVSIANPRVKSWVQLKSKKGRLKQGKFIVEGIHLVKEALQSGAPVECVVYSMDRGIPDEIPRNAGGWEWIAVSEEVLAKCTDTITPQPVFAVVRKLPWDFNVLFASEQPLIVALDAVQDPGNVGTIIRSAEAAGATAVLLGEGTADPYNSKTVRATMGSIFRMPLFECSLPDTLSRVSGTAAQIIGAGLADGWKNCYETDLTKGTWIIVGNEARGIADEAAAYVDTWVKIPMRGKAESLNAAMAATVLLFEAMRQREFSPNKNSCP
jgi:TrmH family RNA methyltransferase